MTTSLQIDALLSQFAVLAYKDTAYLNNTSNLPPGWTLKASDDLTPPFAAFAFKNATTGEVIVAYRGTDGVKDAAADVAILRGKWDPQFQKGMDFAKAVRDSEQIFPDGPDTSKILVTGHSLGGAIAQIVAYAYGLDGSTIDPGAASRIVLTPEFQASAIAAGLLPDRLGASSAFTNYLVAGSLVSGGTGDHIGQSSFLPSVTFSGQQTLTSFLIGLVNPVAGIAYAIGTDQFGNKHSSLQVSQALALLSGDQTNTNGIGSLTLTPKIIGYSNDPRTGLNNPNYSQTEFDVKDAAGVLQSTVKFSGTGSDRMIEVFEPSGALKSTTTLATSGTGPVTITPVTGSTLVIRPLPGLMPADVDKVSVTAKDASGVLQSTATVQTFDDGSKFVTTSYPDGRIDALTYNSDQTLFSRDITSPTPWGTSLVRYNGAGDRVLGITRQTDDDGNVLEITTNADGTGTGRAIAPNGSVINQSSFIKENDAGATGGITSGTVTEQINGKSVAFDAEFSNDTSGAPQITPRGIQSIGGITLASSGLVTADDLKAFGFDFKGAPRPTVEALIAALDPATQQANNWAAPDLTVTNLPGNLIQRSLELGNGITLSSIRTSGGQLVTTTEVQRSGDGSFVTLVKDSEGKLLTNTSTEYIYDQTNVSRIETVTNGAGFTVRNVFDDDGTLASTNNITTGGANIGQTVATAIDFLSLIKAIQTGQPLPVLASGLRLANDLSNLSGNVNLDLSGAANVATGILSLYSLSAALERGDTLGAITAGASAITAGATAYANFVGTGAVGNVSAIATEFGANSAFAALENALPYLNIINSIAHGDVTGVAVAVIDIVLIDAAVYAVPYIGWAYAAYSIISSLWDDEEQPAIPPPWGNGQFKWAGAGADTSLSTQTVGERGGDQAVTNVMTNVLATLNSIIERQRQQNPGSALGIIANRMPGVSYDGTGYRYTDINPLTGEEKHPELRFDVSGRPYNATPGSPESYQSITEGIVRSALARGAIAPLWEVQTAKLQNDAGDPKAGLTEEERAGRDGQLAAPLAATATTQAFRPVMLDLNGNGLQTTTKAAGVAFDVDDSGYLKQTAWLRGDDGFLIIDRNLNDKIDSGKELFANGTVALGRRGLAGMAWADSNYDGKLSPSDPVWAELKVWQDLNQNGSRDAGEAKTLTALGITELNYALSTFTQVNATTGATQVKQLASPDLEADKDGTRVTVVPEGILVQASQDGHLSLLVSRVDDRTALEVNRDGITGFEDIETIVNSRDLLANDYYQNRSCLRSYLLGCRPKTHLKTAQKCSKSASHRAKNARATQKRTDLGRKSSHSSLFICASSYENYSECAKLLPHIAYSLPSQNHNNLAKAHQIGLVQGSRWQWTGDRAEKAVV